MLRKDGDVVSLGALHQAPEADFSSRRRQTAAPMLVMVEERPDHGYGLAERVKPATNSFGRVYRSLHWLEEVGFVQGTWDTANAGSARRCSR